MHRHRHTLRLFSGFQLKKDVARPIHRESMLATDTSGMGTFTEPRPPAPPQHTQHGPNIGQTWQHQAATASGEIRTSFLPLPALHGYITFLAPWFWPHWCRSSSRQAFWWQQVAPECSFCRTDVLPRSHLCIFGTCFTSLCRWWRTNSKRPGEISTKPGLCHWRCDVAIFKILSQDRCWTWKVVQASDWGYKLRKLTKSTAVMDWNYLTTCNIDAKILWIFWSNNEGLLNVQSFLEHYLQVVSMRHCHSRCWANCRVQWRICGMPCAGWRPICVMMMLA